DMQFVHNNSSIHTAKRVKAWLADRGISRFELPPYSPDLNPQENLWFSLKAKLNKMRP
ncbi:uncharacterized protein K452DRAFT_210298, partial [Aplosporella prunicola CBS 121167]